MRLGREITPVRENDFGDTRIVERAKRIDGSHFYIWCGIWHENFVENRPDYIETAAAQGTDCDDSFSFRQIRTGGILYRTLQKVVRLKMPRRFPSGPLN